MSKHTITIVAAVALWLTVLAWVWHPRIVGAEVQREIWAPVAHKNEPVVLTRITLGGRVVQVGRFVRPRGTDMDPVTPFEGDENWIQGLVLHLLNRTNRTIVFAMIHISFPETTNGNQRLAYHLTLGRIPPSADFDQNGKSIPQAADARPLSFRPGTILMIPLRDYIDEIRSRIEPTLPLALTTKLAVSFGRSYLDDGMQWTGATYSLPDRGSISWRKVDRNYFPGDMESNWPGRPGWTGWQ